MAVTFPSGSNGTATFRMGAVHDDLYRKSAETFKGMSAYWAEIVTGLAGPPAPMFASLYIVESFDDLAVQVEPVHFVDAPPDDTDW